MQLTAMKSCRLAPLFIDRVDVKAPAQKDPVLDVDRRQLAGTLPRQGKRNGENRQSGVPIFQPPSTRSAVATCASGGNKYRFQEWGPTTNPKQASSSRRPRVDKVPALADRSNPRGSSSIERISS